jgi:hypothetical protein
MTFIGVPPGMGLLKIFFEMGGKIIVEEFQ